MTADRDKRAEPGCGRLLVEAAGVAAGTVAFQLPIFDRWFSHMDEGHVLLFADIVAKGGELYRDATLYPLPGAFYALAKIFEVFGASILVSRWVVTLEFAAFVAMIFLLMRRAVSRGGALVAVLGMLAYRVWAFPHWQVYSYSTTSLLLVLASSLCLLRFLDARRIGWIAGSGLLFGLGVYCKQDYGAAALVVLGTTLVAAERARGLPAWRPLAVFVGAGALVGACVGAWFAWQGVLPDLLQQTILNHLRGIGSFEYSTYPRLFPLFVQDPAIRSQAGVFAFFPGIVTTVDLESLRQNFLFRETFVYDVALKAFYWGPYAFAAFALGRVVRLRGRLRDAARAGPFACEVLLAGFTAAFVGLLTVNRPQDFLHVAVLLWPMICLSVIYGAGLGRRHRGTAVALGLVLVLPAAAVVGYAARGYVLLRDENDTRVELPRAGIRVRPSEAAMLADVTAFMQEETAPGETVAVVPYFPMVHFLADRPGPDRSAYIVWPFPEFADRDRRIIDSMERKGTRVAVYNFTQFATFPRMDEYAPELFDYLVDHFETVRVFSYDAAGFRLAGLVRSAVPERPSPLLDQAWEDTTLWLGSGDGPPIAVLPEAAPGFVQRAAWPFRRTLALRPAADGRTTVFRVPFVPEPGDVLQTAVGLHPAMWFAQPAFETRFEIALVPRSPAPGAAPRRDVVYTRTLDPQHELSDRRWFDVVVPLDAWSGRDLWLELSVSVSGRGGESLLAGGFAEPRIVKAGGKGPVDETVKLGGASGPVAD